MDKIEAIVEWAKQHDPNIITEVNELPSGFIYLDLELSGIYIVVEYYFREDLLGVTKLIMDGDLLDQLVQDYSPPDYVTGDVDEATSRIKSIFDNG